MNYDQSNTFMTREGFCHLLPDHIILTKDGRHELARYREPKISARLQAIVYLCLLTGLLAYNSWKLYAEDKALSIFFAAAVLFFVLRFIRNMRYSQTNIIPRDRIRAVRFIKAFPYLTRSRLIVTFEDENGKLQMSLVPLPGWLNEGDRHTAEAIALLEKEELLPFSTVSTEKS
jgi:hypothetical protein